MRSENILQRLFMQSCPYRVMGEDRHALFPVTQSNDPIFYEEFDEVHYGLWAKVLTDEEYQEIVDTVTKNE